jgi:phenylpyruvate tautomerase PptA (4-oxalocrotonate tautomerase family)
MPVVRVRASRKGSGRFETLARKVTETTSDLLVESDRVLVVYGKQTASIYYEGEPLSPVKSLTRAS